MRDEETIETALHAAETGHLVMSTLHTLDAVETVNRIIGMFPPHQQKQIRLALSAVLKGVISQRLVPRADGKGMVPAVEILVHTARMRELMEDPKRTREIRDAIANGRNPYGMMTFDQCLADLVHAPAHHLRDGAGGVDDSGRLRAAVPRRVQGGRDGHAGRAAGGAAAGYAA